MDKNPEKLPLFGGLAGAQLETDEFEICEGLVLRQTYAHLMSPYILAFALARKAGQACPRSRRMSKSAGGGQWSEKEGVEVALREDVAAAGGMAAEGDGRVAAYSKTLVIDYRQPAELEDATGNSPGSVAGTGY